MLQLQYALPKKKDAHHKRAVPLGLIDKTRGVPNFTCLGAFDLSLTGILSSATTLPS